MLFVSFTFLFFLPVVVLVRWIVPERWAAPWLLVSSYVFYLSWGPIYGLLLATMTLVGYGCALAMERTTRRRKLIGAGGIATSLGVLAFFKYSGFLATQGFNIAQLAGHDGPVPQLDIVLPLGISFYLFQIISYIVDVARGQKAERSILHFALYVSFFPQLVAGPIVRASELIPQLRRVHRFDGNLFGRGMFLMLRGFIKKAVFADNLALWSDQVFAQHAQVSTLGLWTGVLAYTAQIYCDFSGYTDIARGSAMMLGYEIPENFNLPYLASSPADFWRRWHMTLSRWLRDYLYIPLGGNRKGRPRTYVNLMITMALGGLWHGAHWRFVVWGVYHGLLLALHKGWSAITGKAFETIKDHPAYRFVAIVLTLLAVALGWVFFRAESLADALAILAGLVRHRPHGQTPEDMRMAIWLLAVFAVGHLMGSARILERSVERLPAVTRGLVWASMVAVVYLFASATDVFIYFQF